MKRIDLKEINRVLSVKRILKQRKINKERANEYNKLFAKSPIFKISLGIRLLFILVISIHLLVDESWTTSNNEIVVDVHTELHYEPSGKKYRFGRQSSKVQTFYLTTDAATYSSEKTKYCQGLKNGDTVNVIRNIVGKPIYYSKINMPELYIINSSVFYYILFVITIISIPFTSGSDSVIKTFIYTTSLSSILAILFFFIF